MGSWTVNGFRARVSCYGIAVRDTATGEDVDVSAPDGPRIYGAPGDIEKFQAWADARPRPQERKLTHERDMALAALQAAQERYQRAAQALTEYLIDEKESA